MPAQPPDLQPCMEAALAPELLQEAPPAVATHHASLLEADTLFFLKTRWRNGGVICLQAAVSWPSAEGLWWPPLSTAEQPTHAQQTCVYCLEAAKSTHKGEELSGVLEVNSSRRPLEMQRVGSDGRLWLLWSLKPTMCWCSTCKLPNWTKAAQYHTLSLFTDPDHFLLIQIWMLKKQTNKPTKRFHSERNWFWKKLLVELGFLMPLIEHYLPFEA